MIGRFSDAPQHADKTQNGGASRRFALAETRTAVDGSRQLAMVIALRNAGVGCENVNFVNTLFRFEKNQ